MPATAETKTGVASLADSLRRHDRDRYLMALFAPAEKRTAVMALYAFNFEIARIRETVSQPVLGQIRLQWWREGLDAAYTDAAVRKHEVLTPLAQVIRRYRPSRGFFDQMLDARERDLGHEALPTLEALETFAGETSGALQMLVLQMLGTEEGLANSGAWESGTAYAVMGLLRATAFNARQGRHYFPPTLIEKYGVDLDALYAGRPSRELAEAAQAVADLAERNLIVTRDFRSHIPAAARAALLPAVLAAADLKRLRRAHYDVFAPSVMRLDPWRSWRLSRAALTGRY